MSIRDDRIRPAGRGPFLSLVLVAIAASAPAAYAAAPQQVEQSRPAAADARLRVGGLIAGNVQISGWDRAEVHLNATHGEVVRTVRLEGGPDRFEVTIDLDHAGHPRDARERRRHHDDMAVNLQLRVPRGASLEVHSVTGSITVEGVDGVVALEAVTGSIDYAGESPDVRLKTVTGSITARATALRSGAFDTVQGSIRYEGGFEPAGRATFTAVGGSIDLLVPADVSARFEATTLNGRIATEFDVQPVRADRWLPSQELSFSAGAGEATVRIDTLQGPIRLRRR